MRVAVLLVLMLEPPLWLFLLALFGWGVNMGVASTLVRTSVQELAEPRLRAQILAILLVSFMVSAPVSSVLLGLLVEWSDPLTGLWPGIAVSLLIFLAGRYRGGLWDHRSPPPHPAPFTESRADRR
jgi:MFS family permease